MLNPSFPFAPNGKISFVLINVDVKAFVFSQFRFALLTAGAEAVNQDWAEPNADNLSAL